MAGGTGLSGSHFGGSILLRREQLVLIWQRGHATKKPCMHICSSLQRGKLRTFRDAPECLYHSLGKELSRIDWQSCLGSERHPFYIICLSNIEGLSSVFSLLAVSILASGSAYWHKDAFRIFNHWSYGTC